MTHWEKMDAGYRTFSYGLRCPKEGCPVNAVDEDRSPAVRVTLYEIPQARHYKCPVCGTVLVNARELWEHEVPPLEAAMEV